MAGEPSMNPRSAPSCRAPPYQRRTAKPVQRMAEEKKRRGRGKKETNIGNIQMGLHAAAVNTAPKSIQEVNHSSRARAKNAPAVTSRQAIAPVPDEPVRTREPPEGPFGGRILAKLGSQYAGRHPLHRYARPTGATPVLMYSGPPPANMGRAWSQSWRCGVAFSDP